MDSIILNTPPTTEDEESGESAHSHSSSASEFPEIIYPSLDTYDSILKIPYGQFQKLPADYLEIGPFELVSNKSHIQEVYVDTIPHYLEFDTCSFEQYRYCLNCILYRPFARNIPLFGSKKFRISKNTTHFETANDLVEYLKQILNRCVVCSLPTATFFAPQEFCNQCNEDAELYVVQTLKKYIDGKLKYPWPHIDLYYNKFEDINNAQFPTDDMAWNVNKWKRGSLTRQPLNNELI